MRQSGLLVGYFYKSIVQRVGSRLCHVAHAYFVSVGSFKGGNPSGGAFGGLALPFSPAYLFGNWAVSRQSGRLLLTFASFRTSSPLLGSCRGAFVLPPPPPKPPRTTPFHALFGRLEVGGSRRGEPLQPAEKPCFSSSAALRKVKRNAAGRCPARRPIMPVKYAHRFTRPAKKLPQPPLLARASKCYAPLPAGTRDCGIWAVGMASAVGIQNPNPSPHRRGCAPPCAALTGGKNVKKCKTKW